MSILIVDDQPINRVCLSRLLETFDFPVLHASNGLEGLQLYMQHRAAISLIFLDLMMPVLDGWSAALKIRSIEEERAWGSVPIVAYTSEDVSLGSPLWERCIESGMNDVVGKPIDRTYTYQLLARYLPFWAPPPPPPPPTVASSRSSLDLSSPSRGQGQGPHQMPRSACHDGSLPDSAAASPREPVAEERSPSQAAGGAGSAERPRARLLSHQPPHGGPLSLTVVLNGCEGEGPAAESHCWRVG